MAIPFRDAIRNESLTRYMERSTETNESTKRKEGTTWKWILARGSPKMEIPRDAVRYQDLAEYIPT